MSINILYEFVDRLERTIEELQERVNKEYDFTEVERILGEQVDELLTLVLARMLKRFHEDPGLLARLKELGARLGMRFKELKWFNRLEQLINTV